MKRSVRNLRRTVLAILAAGSLALLTTAAGCQPGEPCPYPPGKHRSHC
ncbi:hypothetical protein Ga0074812_13730 [Parafrankia irregularis]|uniref:Lipoprotein n=1 Tax=Parafrankia irregularis TaxID=795642 RepID=A0A0S4R0A0_9ACTN|nr:MULTISPECIES: hypothetical protein [Frankiaceae]EFC83576.1 hypothetical protein FrEUN1fDRAFT_3273 [Parafrankia sp. EUN1f]MBE3203383.1 hypothetical protein [Parafrankia sp. CH37]CUU60246.1 hypothetical protein Ga0074812_13730 [Parafrankia irregularis]